MEVKLPQFSEDGKGAELTMWHVKEADRVMEGQDILEVSTDKATFDIPAPCTGVVEKIFKQAGQSAATDEVIAEIREDHAGS